MTEAVQQWGWWSSRLRRLEEERSLLPGVDSPHPLRAFEKCGQAPMSGASKSTIDCPSYGCAAGYGYSPRRLCTGDRAGTSGRLWLLTISKSERERAMASRAGQQDHPSPGLGSSAAPSSSR